MYTADANITAMDSWCNRDCAVALAKIGGKQTVLVSLYLDINLDVRPGWLDGLMAMIEDKKFPVIMGVDSNAHSVMYGPDSNHRGNAFEDFILQYGMKVENSGRTPTFDTRRGNKEIKTFIDVTLTRDLTTDIHNWRVSTEYNASDHNNIHFEVVCHKPEPEVIRPWSKADWSALGKELGEADYRIPKDMSMKKLDKLVSRLYSLLEGCLLYTSPSPRDRQKSRMPSSA